MGLRRGRSHNIANQVYGKGDIGKTKVKALAEIVKAQTGCELKVHETKVDGTQEMGDVVFLLTDTMSSRKEIWTKGLRYKTKIKLMIETRMGSDTGRGESVSAGCGSRGPRYQARTESPRRVR